MTYETQIAALKAAAKDSREEFHALTGVYPESKLQSQHGHMRSRSWICDFGRTYPASLYVTTKAFDEAWEAWHNIFEGR